VSGVELGMGVLDFGGDRRRGRSSFGVNLERPIVTNWAFATRSPQICDEVRDFFAKKSASC